MATSEPLIATSAIDRSRVVMSIVVYILLTFSLSGFFYWKVIHAGSMEANHGLFVFGLMWSPGFSALATRLIFQGNLRGEGWGWGKTKYQLWSYVLPLLYSSAVYLPVWIAGGFNPDSQIMTLIAGKVPSVPFLAREGIIFGLSATAGVLGSCISALGEELGWRGFLVPQLAKVSSFLTVSLISGGIWALWHMPLIIWADYRGAGPVWYSVTCFAVLVVGSAFLFAWMRLKSGSLWTGVILHASHNLFIQAFYDAQTKHSKFADLWTTEFGAGLAIAAIVIAIVCYRKRGELPTAALA
jgi:uncharacterized protein